MKLKKLLALTLAGAVLTVSLTACTPLEAIELMYDWLFGGGSSNASHSNGTGVEESKTLEENIIQRLGLTNTPRHEDVAEPVLQEVAKSFDPDRWYNNSGERYRCVRFSSTFNGNVKFCMKATDEVNSLICEACKPEWMKKSEAEAKQQVPKQNEVA